MDKISFADFRRVSIEQSVKKMPLCVTVEGQPAFYAVTDDDIIVVTDLHPRVRTMLRAMEKRARAGMPNKPVKLADLQSKPEGDTVIVKES